MLKAGKDVTLDDGRVVRSCDVVGDTAPPSSSLVLDIPGLEYMDSLESCEKLRAIDSLETIFHFSPDNVVTSPRYKQWLEGMGEKVTHILLNESCRGDGLPEVTAFTHKLRIIKEELFPVLVGAQENSAENMVNMVKEGLNNSVIPGVTGLRVNVRPSNLQKIDFCHVVG